MYAWFSRAGRLIDKTDVKCGYTKSTTYNTAQIIWANTNKIGCAFGQRNNGDVRVVCNFAPGAPFILDTKYFCGLIAHKYIDNYLSKEYTDFTDLNFLSSLGFNMLEMYNNYTTQLKRLTIKNQKDSWHLNTLSNIYKNAQLRKHLKDFSNGSKGFIVRLVTMYTFFEESEGRCDSNVPIYAVGPPGSLCVERGRVYKGLCYDFRDPTPGYRLVAVLAPVALFSLILYDLFSGVVRQTNS
jgi:hypothetical protein